MRKLSRSMAAVALAIVPLLAFGADVSINVDQAAPPFMYSKDGKASGIYPALIEATFQRMKVAVSVQAIPWARAFEYADRGDAGVGGIFKNTEREKKFDFSDPLFVEQLLIFYNKNKPINFSKLDDLKGLKVGVIRGWSYGDAFDAARKAGVFSTEEVVAGKQNFGKLETGRLDAVVDVAESAAGIMKEYPSVLAAHTPMAQNPTYVAFSKSINQVDLLGKFNQALKDLKSSGEYDKIVKSALAK